MKIKVRRCATDVCSGLAAEVFRKIPLSSFSPPGRDLAPMPAESNRDDVLSPRCSIADAYNGSHAPFLGQSRRPPWSSCV